MSWVGAGTHFPPAMGPLDDVRTDFGPRNPIIWPGSATCDEKHPKISHFDHFSTHNFTWKIADFQVFFVPSGRPRPDYGVGRWYIAQNPFFYMYCLRR